MKHFIWPLVVLLLLISCTCVAQDSANQIVLSDEKDGQDHESTNSHQVHPKSAAQESVRQASHILQKIKPPVASKLAKYTRKPTGILGGTIYYAKQAFTLLFLTSPIKTSPVISPSTDTPTPKLPKALAEAVALLEDAANAETPSEDALFLLAEMNFHGNYTHPVSYPRAFNYYQRLADLEGNRTAQYMLGFMYATGLNPVVGQDQAKSMLYHTFAAEQDDTRAEMTLAYRYHAGISTPRNCEEAVRLYRNVAVKAIEFYRSGPPGGHSLIRNAYRIADDVGGVYGEGASFSSAGANAKHGGPTSDAYADVEDVLEYLFFQSSKGDLKATFGLARLYYDGGRGLKRDLRMAKKYFMEIARLFWDPEGKLRKDAPAGGEKIGAKAAGYLGRMFLRGEGMKQSFTKARIWFQRGIVNGDALSQYSLGLIYLDALGVDENVEKAADLFGAAADQDLAVAQTHLGVLFLDQGDVATAIKYFDLAARNSHIEAFFYLAELNNQGTGRERNCNTATIYYKIVVEKAEAIWSSLAEASDAYESGDQQKALIGYLMAAEQGSENSQANVAWILDESRPRWSLLSWFVGAGKSISRLAHGSRLALRYWTRSARQSNLDSLVKMGDYYLEGIGVSSSSNALMPQPEHAAACYQAAAETLQSAQAMWNLGWMHENGLGGVEQDFHLAKRFYDQALATNTEAYLPVKLSLFKLRWRSWWNRVTYGSVNSIQEDDNAKTKRTFMEWLAEFLEADARQAYEAQQEQQQYEADDWETGGREQVPGSEEYWDEAADIDDDIVITLIIGGLIAILLWLFWYRQQQQRAVEQRRRQAVQQGDAAQADVNIADEQRDRGVFPPPGDPAWNQWVAGGVGH